jgi:hypothetical protein
LLCSGGWLHVEVGPWIQVLLLTSFGSTDTTTAYPIHPKRVRRNDSRLDPSRGGVQGWPHQQGRSHLLVWPHQQGWPRLAGVAQRPTLYAKCVLAYKIYNTTGGTLLVLKTCMKLALYPPRFRDFDGQKLFVRTVNKLLKLNVCSSSRKV